MSLDGGEKEKRFDSGMRPARQASTRLREPQDARRRRSSHGGGFPYARPARPCVFFFFHATARSLCIRPRHAQSRLYAHGANEAVPLSGYLRWGSSNHQPRCRCRGVRKAMSLASATSEQKQGQYSWPALSDMCCSLSVVQITHCSSRRGRTLVSFVFFPK